MKNKFTKLTLAFMALILLLVPMPNTALPAELISAQNEENAQPDPNFTGLKLRRPAGEGFVYEFVVQPGESVSGNILAQHDFEQEDLFVEYFLIPSDFFVDPDLGTVIYPERNFFLDERFSLARWISFDREKVGLNRYGQEEEITFTVNVPADAAAGSYYAALLFSDLTAAQYRGEERLNQDQTGATIGSRLAPIVIVTVAGDLTTAVDISALEVLDQDLKKPFLGIHEYLPVRIRTKLAHSGNFVTNPTGNIFIHKGDEGDPVATIVFNPNANRLLPGVTRPYFNTWDDANILFRPQASFPGGGHISYKSDADGGLRMGRYFVDAKVRYQNQNAEAQLVTMSETFWIIPWKLILALVLVIVILGFVIYRKTVAGDRKKSTASKRSAIATR